MTLTDFLLARIAEDEAVARAASHQKVAGPFHGKWQADSALLMANGALERIDREHIARHDPARILGECEAKRCIADNPPERYEDGEAREDDAYGEWFWTCRVLASVYASHPDYDEGWKL